MDDVCLSGRIEAIARAVRAFLEPRWADWHLHEGSPSLKTPSQGTCGRSSLFLRDVLRSHGFQAEFVAGTPSEGDEGFRCGAVWCGHAWVECAGWIVDVTADQFGDDPVIVTYVGDQRYKAGVDGSAPEFLARRQKVAWRLMVDWNEREGEIHET